MRILLLALSASLVFGAFLGAAPATAQSGGEFEIVRATIDGGGSTERTADPILLRGTIGQPDAGASAFGVFYLKSGFWSSQGRLGVFFVDGFESGDTSAWSLAVGESLSSNPAGVVFEPAEVPERPLNPSEKNESSVHSAVSPSAEE